MPGGRDECPVEVRIIKLTGNRDLAYLEYNRHYTDNERALNTYCRIQPTKGDAFGLYVALYDDFDWHGCTHLKVSLFVDGWYVRTQFLEPNGKRHIEIKRGRKFDQDLNVTVQFACIVGDVESPGPHELDGTISIELSLGNMVFRRPRQPRANLVEETNTFKHGPSELVRPPRPGSTMFASAPRRVAIPMRWYFLYAEKTYRSGTAPVSDTFDGLGKRSRESDEQTGDAQDYDFKRTRRHGGLEAEFSPPKEESPREEGVPAVRQDKPMELFPEYNGMLYVEVPAYGSFR